MSQFRLPKGSVNSAVPVYGGLETLRNIIRRNVKRFEEFYSMGNRVADNQHPLVQFLLQISVNLEWTPEYLFNVIRDQQRKIASQVGMTSLYNKGKDFSGWFYPENNHKTLLVVPFDENPIQWDMSTVGINYGVGLKPVMTNSTTHYWNIDNLLDSVNRVGASEQYSILQLDPCEFVFGYYWYLKNRQKAGVNIGLSPHHYVTLVIQSLYIHHNELVNLNVLYDDVEITVQRPGFALESYSDQLEKYVIWERRFLMTERIKSFSEMLDVCKTTFDVDRLDMVCPDVSKSMMFPQLGWAYTLASLHYATGYFHFMDYMGAEDGLVEAKLQTFFKTPYTYATVNIKDPNWRNFYINNWLSLKER